MRFPSYQLKIGRKDTMTPNKSAIAGTLESSDIQAIYDPTNEPLEITLKSTVMDQYGEQIYATALAAAQQLEVTTGKLSLVDNGALDCTVKARVQTVLLRAMEWTENLPWEEKLS